ncbi:MAG TPA: hypothetical protein VE890_16130 [Thermoguttaceae bacterium]|nr:hypothetical protein [Thermoguttaceae bacterium]
MERLLQSSPEQAIASLALLAVFVAAAWYVLGLIREKAAQQEPTASELLSKFRESHSEGVLSDEEFRTIKTTLAAQIQEELKDNDETG